jgi:hypothetical protein
VGITAAVDLSLQGLRWCSLKSISFWRDGAQMPLETVSELVFSEVIHDLLWIIELNGKGSEGSP